MGKKMVWVEPTIQKYIEECLIIDTTKKSKLSKEVIVEQIMKTIRLFTVVENGKQPLTDWVYNYRLIEFLPNEVKKVKKKKWLIDLPLTYISLSELGLNYLEEYNQRVYENQGLETVFIDRLLKSPKYLKEVKNSIAVRMLGLKPDTTPSTQPTPSSSIDLQQEVKVSGEIEIKGLKEILGNGLIVNREDNLGKVEFENRGVSDFQGAKDIEELRELSNKSIKEIRSIIGNLKDNLNGMIPMTTEGMAHPLYDTLTRVYGLYFVEKNETNLYKKVDNLENGIADAYAIIDLLKALDGHYEKIKNK